MCMWCNIIVKPLFDSLLQIMAGVFMRSDDDLMTLLQHPDRQCSAVAVSVQGHDWLLCVHF